MKHAQYTTTGSVGVVTLSRPERLNAIGAELLRDLHEALNLAQHDATTKAIVLTGAGRAFCAGDDLKEFALQTQSAASIAETCQGIQQITRDIMFGPKLVVGAMHGYAVGGGFEWLLNCDFVVASDELVCFFPEMSLGHFVTGALTHLLPRAVGHQRAMELIVLGERQSAADLKALGLVNRVVPLEKLMDSALEVAQRFASKSQFATMRLKRVMTTQLDQQVSTALEVELQVAMECFGNEDTANRIARFSKDRLSRNRS
ncbi:MAG: enoyl-CoA hydratase/isomerase family protein [Burkholderiaceae bacterium]|nr:enoyl-CoA hydratase/isomerase family protein [Burkholderiaceae bacterium]